jgi:hypothetical protein
MFVVAFDFLGFYDDTELIIFLGVALCPFFFRKNKEQPSNYLMPDVSERGWVFDGS